MIDSLLAGDNRSNMNFGRVAFGQHCLVTKFHTPSCCQHRVGDNQRFVINAGRSDIFYENLEKLVTTVGKQRLTMDLSCRKRNGKYYIVTDRWQKFTEEEVTEPLLHHLTEYCDEFLIHAVDVEGKASGIETELVELLAKMKDFPVTYAGGVGNFADLELLKKVGNDHVDVTIGSALDLFGGNMKFEDVLEMCRR